MYTCVKRPGNFLYSTMENFELRTAPLFVRQYPVRISAWQRSQMSSSVYPSEFCDSTIEQPTNVVPIYPNFIYKMFRIAKGVSETFLRRQHPQDSTQQITRRRPNVKTLTRSTRIDFSRMAKVTSYNEVLPLPKLLSTRLHLISVNKKNLFGQLN